MEFILKKKYFTIDRNLLNKKGNILRNYVEVNSKKIELFKNKLSEIGNVVTIYICKNDTTYLKDYLYNLPISYFKNALLQLNLSDYTVLLLSDSVSESIDFIKPLNIKKLITSENIINNNKNEEQFLLMCVSRIRIFPNSILSLMSCYINEIYNFVDNPIYILPDIWFSEKNPGYNINELIPQYNPNFYLIPEDSSNIMKKKSDIIFDTNILSKKKYKCSVIFFHKNINKLYKKRWVNKCIETILNQTYSDFDIFEINYGSDNYSIFNHYHTDKRHYFFNKNYKTHTEAMLFLLNICFDYYKYDIVFNTNLDDYYHLERFKYQIEDVIKNNSFLNSSCWQFIEEKNNKDILSNHFKENSFFIENGEIRKKNLDKIHFYIDNSSISYKKLKEQLLRNNIINHSSVCFTRKFWNSYDIYGNYLRYRDEKPFEDYSLWKRACNNNIPINIINKSLIFYRIHTNQIGEKSKKNDKDDTFKKKEIKGENIFGILIEIHNRLDIEKILYCNNNYLKGENKFYYFYCNNKISEEIYKNLSYNQIDNFEIFFYKDKEDNLKKIIKNFDISIIYRSDYFLHFNKIENVNKQNIIGNSYFKNTEIMKFINSNQNYITQHNTTFYTMIYKIKSKFDFDKYIEWGKNLINFIDQELIIFTNKDTYEILKPLVLNKINIKIIFKEFDDFKFIKYKEYLKKNTDKLYFPKHQIDYKLILIWLERHITLDEIQSKKDNICYLDWGYFREKVDSKLNFNLISYSDLYLPLVSNQYKNICKVTSLLMGGNHNIEQYISNSLHRDYAPIIGGGGFIIKMKYIKEYKKSFLNIFDKLYEEKMNLKDDQTILTILYLRYNKGNINLIKRKDNKDTWFPLETILSGSCQYELLKQI